MTVGICYCTVYPSPVLSLWAAVGSRATVTARTILVTPTSEVLLRLVRLPDEALRLRTPLPVRVWWDASAEGFVAGEELLRQWFGVGQSHGAALADLGEVLVEVFRDFAEDPERLGPALRRDFEELSQVIVYADQSA